VQYVAVHTRNLVDRSQSSLVLWVNSTPVWTNRTLSLPAGFI